jgi:TolB protein
MRSSRLPPAIIGLVALVTAGALIPLAGAPETRLAEVAAFPGSNGRIAFHSDRDGDFDIFILTPMGTRVRKLTRNHDDGAWPAWSADGQQSVFQSNRDSNTEDFEIYTWKPCIHPGGLNGPTRL